MVEAVRLYDASLPVMGLPGSVLLTIADEAGLRTVTEATLVPRSRPGAVLHDPAVVAERMIRMVTTGLVQATNGTDITVRADSICVHGDSPGAVEMAIAVRRALGVAGVDIRPFAS